VAQWALRKYGELAGYQRDGFGDPAVRPSEHYYHCTADQWLDFMEVVFRDRDCRLGLRGVEAINTVLREDGIGYAFTTIQDQWPQAIIKNNEVLHQAAVMPALQLLSGRRWDDASEHLRQAHQHLRQAHWRDAINQASAALETTIKIICQAKGTGWEYPQNQATVGTLVQVVIRNGLLPPFYEHAIVNSSGSLRNKMGGHGRDPGADGYDAESHHAHHMVNVTSAHILLLVQAAGIL